MLNVSLSSALPLSSQAIAEHVGSSLLFLFIYLLIYLLWSRGRERLEATSDGCNCAQSTVRAARAGMCVGSDCYMSELKGLLVVNLF